MKNLRIISSFIIVLFLTYNIQSQNDIIKEVDQMPVHMDCASLNDEAEKMKCSNSKLISFIVEHLNYPETAKKANIQGTVISSFVVNKSGTLEEIQIVKGLTKECDQEVLRVLALMNTEAFSWSPGMKDEKAVKVEMKLPVQFKLPKE
jgi:TonB family protein